MSVANPLPFTLDNLVVSRLTGGSMCAAEFDILLSMTDLSSEKVIEALRSYAVFGNTPAVSYHTAGISQQQFDRGFKVLNTAFKKNETLWEFRYSRHLADVIAFKKAQKGSE